MRSSVSVILSSPTPDNNMSHPQYEQNAHDHGTLLILVKQIGDEITSKVYNKIYERISKIISLNVMDSSGVERIVRARYVKEYLVGNNDWGDFQTHRRLLGLITIGKCSSQAELNEVCRVHESLKVKYTNTLYDSRCLIIGVNDGPNTPSFPTPSNFKSRAIFYATDGKFELLESQVTEFLSTLFWVLESKRHERCREKIDKVSLLLAPFERRDFVGLDMESRSNRKRSVGRMTKHLGDLCLQAGLPTDAMTHYQTASEILRSINDWLWLGGALEGLCAASALIHYPNMSRSSPVKKNSSLPETQPRSNQESKLSKEVDYSSVEPKSVVNLLKNSEDIIRYYREAIVHYSKYQNAAVIETEACYKAARLAIQHHAYLHAANFLHSVTLINLALNEEEKIERLMSLSELYTKIGFQRKASFYRRLAATRFVSARNPQTNWQQCYNLMLQALPGHKISLEPADHSPDELCGWPGLQKQVLHDLVLAATRVGQSAVATRHMTFLLQVMWTQLTAAEKREFAMQLRALSAQCEGSPVPLVLDSGLVIPPVNLISVPTTLSFTVMNLKPHLRPSKLEKTKENFGPFLFTPINFGSLERKSSKSNNKVDYLWIADEPCEVKLELSNPFPFELEVSNMRLLTSGVVFESLPVTVVLPPEAPSVSVKLSGTSKEVGLLEITGYSTHTLGVKSNCRLKSIPKIGRPMFSVEVIPALPLLEIRSDLPNSTSSGSPISLYAGERVDWNIELVNTGELTVQWIEVSLDCLQEYDQVLSWDDEHLKAQLPIETGSSVSLPLHFYGAASFLSNNSQETGSVKSSIFSTPSSLLSSTSNRAAPSDKFLAKSTTPSFKSGGSSLSSFSSHFSKICIENSPKTFQCLLKVRYSSDPGMSAGYCRVCTYEFSLDIKPSVFITNWDVIPAETSSQFYLVLDIANMTSQELELKYGSNKSLLMEENDSCRIPVAVERCPLTKIGKLFKSGESLNELMEVNKLCSSHIASLVDLQWNLVSGSHSGQVSLHGITLSLSMLDVVRMSPIAWEVLVNGVKVEPQQELNVVVSQSLLLGINMINSLSWSLKDLDLDIQFFQDYQNGTTNYQLDTHIACSGSTHVQLDEVADFGNVYHECVVVFLTPGQFKVNIQCSTKEKFVWRLIPPLDIQVSKADN